MTSVTGLTAARMIQIENASVVDGDIVGNNLILRKFDGNTIDAGNVRGPQGIQGPQGAPGVSAGSMIPGEIRLWPGATLPLLSSYGKWVWADGGVYVTATYPIASGNIDAAWRTFAGASDPGGSNFRIPDMRGLTPVGLDQMPGGGGRANRMSRSVAIVLAGRTGEETHTITIAEMPSHNHDFLVTGANPSGATGVFGANANSDTGLSGPAPVQNRGGGGAHENVQPSVFVPYIVCLTG